MIPLAFEIYQCMKKEDTVLDLGCGILTPIEPLISKNWLCVDLFENSLHHIKYSVSTIKMDMRDTEKFVDYSFDIVLSLDSVEHLEKEDALIFLDEVKRICRKHAFIFTPREWNDNHENYENDITGLGLNELQLHKSFIDRKELEKAGFKIIRAIDAGWLARFDK